MNELHLFSGAGGGILGGLLLGHTPVCAVEIEPYCRKVLLQRQRDGILPWFPIWDDVRTFDGKPWRGIADIVCGGFPCQDVSRANKSAVGANGKRSGLWKEFIRIVEETQAPFALIENSPLLNGRGLDNILREIAAIGYNATWDIFSAAECGAPHWRKRFWCLCWNPNDVRCVGEQGQEQTISDGGSIPNGISWWKSKCLVDRVDNGLARNVDRLKCLANGQVPAVAAKAWHVLCQRAAGTLRKRPAQHTTAAVCNTAGH